MIFLNAGARVTDLTRRAGDEARATVRWIVPKIDTISVAIDRAFKTFPSQGANALDAGGAAHAGMIAVAAMRWIPAHIDTAVPAPDQALGATSGIRI